MFLDELISATEVEQRRQLIRDVMDYKLDDHDHIPILITHFPNTNGYTRSRCNSYPMDVDRTGSYLPGRSGNYQQQAYENIKRIYEKNERQSK
jgi:hypothetical protein